MRNGLETIVRHTTDRNIFRILIVFLVRTPSLTAKTWEMRRSEFAEVWIKLLKIGTFVFSAQTKLVFFFVYYQYQPELTRLCCINRQKRIDMKSLSELGFSYFVFNGHIININFVTKEVRWSLRHSQKKEWNLYIGVYDVYILFVIQIRNRNIAFRRLLFLESLFLRFWKQQ